ELELADQGRWKKVQSKIAEVAEAKQIAESERVSGIRVAQWLKRPESSHFSMPQHLHQKFSDEIWDIVETDLKYEGYVRRQKEAIEKSRDDEARQMPHNVDYANIPGL